MRRNLILLAAVLVATSGCASLGLRPPLPYGGVGVEAGPWRALVLADGTTDGPVTVDSELVDYTQCVVGVNVGPARVEVRIPSEKAPTFKIGGGVFVGARVIDK